MWLRGCMLICMLVEAGCGSSKSSAPAPLDGTAGTGGTISLGVADADTGCHKSAGGTTDLDAGGSDPLCSGSAPVVSYTKDVAPILTGCTGEVCHVPWQYDTVVRQHSVACCDLRWLVAPGQPSASHIVQAVTGKNACVPQMPKGGSLSSSEISTLIAWVCQGAKND